MGKPLKQIEKDPSIDNFVEGLYIKNGRLMNARMDGMSGIAKAALYRKEMKKQ